MSQRWWKTFKDVFTSYNTAVVHITQSDCNNSRPAQT